MAFVHFPLLASALASIGLSLLPACSLELPGTGSRSGVGSELPLWDAGQDAPGADAAPADAAPARLEAATQEHDAGPSGCALTGRYALEVSFDVSWIGTQFAGIVPVISAGEGELSFMVLGELRESARGADATFRACQANVPEFVSTLPQERYAVHFPDQVWDSPTMPLFNGELTSCREPPCALTSSPIYSLIGASLGDPADRWPSSASAGDWPDHDGDGHPGIAAIMSGPSEGYAYPPVDLVAFRRVRELRLGLRVIQVLHGKRDSCDRLSGEVEQGAVDTRALGCVASAGRSSACSGDELRFLDDNLPAWTVRQGTFRGVRLKDGADCMGARRMFAKARAGSQ